MLSRALNTILKGFDKIFQVTSVDNKGASVVSVAADKAYSGRNSNGFTITITASDFGLNMSGTEDRFYTDQDIM